MEYSYIDKLIISEALKYYKKGKLREEQLSSKDVDYIDNLIGRHEMNRRTDGIVIKVSRGF